MAEGVGATVPETVRRTVEAVAAINTTGLVSLPRGRRRLGLDKSNASRRLRRAADGGYLRNREENVASQPAGRSVTRCPRRWCCCRTPRCCATRNTSRNTRTKDFANPNRSVALLRSNLREKETGMRGMTRPSHRSIPCGAAES